MPNTVLEAISTGARARTVLSAALWAAVSWTAACDPPGEGGDRTGQGGENAATAHLPDGSAAEALPGPWLLGDVDLFGDTIVVSHDGDLWTVPREGGPAARLLSAGAADQDGNPIPLPRDRPAFSPSGDRLAFSGGGNVYVRDRSDGSLRRLTYHPRGSLVRGWTPAGDSLLFASYRWKSGNNFQLHAIPAAGGEPRRLPFPFAFDGAASPDGRRLVYQRFGPRNLRNWLSYRGGLSRPLTLVDRAGGGVTDSVPHAAAQDIEPLWREDGIYFASARGRADPGRPPAEGTRILLPGGFDLYRWRAGAGRPERLTAFRFDGIDFLGEGSGSVVLSAEGRLHLFDPGSGTLSPVPARFPEEELAPADSTRVPLAADTGAPAFAPDAGTLVAEVRGDLFAWDRGTGDVRRLTRTPEVREHGPAVSPDGGRVAYWSGRTGQERLYVAPLMGGGQTREIQIAEAPTRYRDLTWSPDGRHLAFSGEALGLWIARPDGATARRIARSEFPGQGRWEHVWGPDGGYLAYAMAEPTGVRGVHIYDLESGRSVRVSDPLAQAAHPAFDPAGRYLWFATGEQAPLAIARAIPGWGMLSSNWNLPLLSARLQVAVLRPGDPTPVLPSGRPSPDALEAVGSADGGEAGPPERRAGLRAAGAESVPALDGLSDRVLPLPPGRRDVLELDAISPGEFLVRAMAWPETPAEAGRVPTPVYRWRLSSPDTLERLLEDADEVVPGPDGDAILYRRAGEWRIARLGDGASGADGLTEGEVLEWGRDSLTVHRRPEWGRMLREVRDRVRTTYVGPERDALDLHALEAHYAAYLPHLRSRDELNTLFRKMLEHLDLVSHLAVFGGARWPRPGRAPRPGEAPTAGLLAADLERDGAGVRLARIFRNNRYTALFPQVYAPLDRPGMRVDEGEYLLAVDGEPVPARGNPLRALVGTAGRTTRLRVGPSPDGTGAREIEVVLVSDDRMLRETTWAEENRRRVEEATGGRVGYVWLKLFRGDLLRNLVGALAALQDRDALIVDIRFNGGGTTADELIEILGRGPLYSYDFRHGRDLRVPAVKAPPRRVLIASQHNASAAETFTFMWKRAGLGPVVGTPTVGALVGASLDQPPLVDGGRLLLPNRASRAPGIPTSRLEGIGVAPDRHVDWTAAEWRAGRDPQLEAAIEEALEGLEASP